MNLDFFKETRLLDGGMGQELLARGMISLGDLWSASAVLDKNQHQLVVDTHLDFAKAGADVIVTNSFTTRRLRLRSNNQESHFEDANRAAGKIAQSVKQSYPKIKIAGSLPPQYDTYVADPRDVDEIIANFSEQAGLLAPFVDCFYLDVLSSQKEIACAITAVKSLGLPYLVGIHLAKDGRLPSSEMLSDVVAAIDRSNCLGVMLSCVSPEVFGSALSVLQSSGLPYGFKLNGFVTTQPKGGYSCQMRSEAGQNPVDILGKRQDLEPEGFFSWVERFHAEGATILGGCCETRPAHIAALRPLLEPA